MLVPVIVVNVVLCLVGVAVLIALGQHRALIRARPEIARLFHPLRWFGLYVVVTAAIVAIASGTRAPLRWHLLFWPQLVLLGLLIAALRSLHRSLQGDLEVLVLRTEMAPQFVGQALELKEIREKLEDKNHQLERRSRQMLLLNQAQEAISAAGSTVEAVSRTAAAQLHDAFGFELVKLWQVGPGDRCSICPHAAICPDKSRCLHLAVSLGELVGDDTLAQRIPIGCFRIGRLAGEGGRARSNEIWDDDTFLSREGIIDRNIRAFAGFALESGGPSPYDVLGLFSAQNIEDDAFQLLSSYARFVAVSLDDANRYEHMDRLVAERTEELQLRNAQLQAQTRQLQESYRVKSEFLATMSHELRTPMTSILGFSELLLKHSKDPLTARQRDALERVDRNGQNLLYLINQILDYSKIEAGHMTIRSETFDPGPLIEDCARNIEGQAIRKGIEIHWVTGPLPRIRCDPHRLIQVLTNLLGNAIKFTAAGRVEVRAVADPQQRWLRVSICDTGIGMATADIPKIFEEFRQIDGSSTRHAGGTGLGLAISRKLVRLMGGELLVRSAPGQGSCFTLVLPVGPSGLEVPPVKPPPTIPPGSSTVLLLEDDLATQQFIRGHLADAGYTVLTARIAVEALQIAESRPIDVAVASLCLPHTDGFQFTARLHQLPAARDVPVLLLSIVEDIPPEEIPEVFACLTKPVEMESLFEVLEQATRRREGLMLDGKIGAPSREPRPTPG